MKKYQVRAMQEAMRLIREDMGPEAVIISSYRLPRKNLLDFFRPLQLEVTAALDEPPAGNVRPAGLPSGREEAACTIEVNGAPGGYFATPYEAADVYRLTGVRRTMLPGGRPVEVEAARPAVSTGFMKGPDTGSAAPSGPIPGQKTRTGATGRPGADILFAAGSDAPAGEGARHAAGAGLTAHTAGPAGLPEKDAVDVTGLDVPAASAMPMAGLPAGEAGEAFGTPGRPAVPAARVENSTVKEKFTVPGQENGPSSFNIILKQQEETLMEGDPARRWRRKLLEMEIMPEIVDRLLDGLDGINGLDGEDGPAAAAEEAAELLRVRLKSRLAALVEPAYRPLSGAAANQAPAGIALPGRPEAPAGQAAAGLPEFARRTTGGERREELLSTRPEASAGQAAAGLPEFARRTTGGERREELLSGRPEAPAGQAAAGLPEFARRTTGGERREELLSTRAEVSAGQAAAGLPAAGAAENGGSRLFGRRGPAGSAEKTVYAFIGPTGVGKTTTLAKLATRLVMFENRHIALVALHSHRFGVAEELKFYGETLGVPAEVVMTPAELAAAVRAHRDKHAVLIDTEGISHRNAAQLLKLKSFLDVLEPGREIFLTLSATTRSRDLLDMAGAFGRTGFTQLVFTKLDETAVRGPALNLVQQTGRPVAYTSAGQNVPDDLEAVTPRRLAALLLEDRD